VRSPSRGSLSGKAWSAFAAAHPAQPGDVLTLSRQRGDRSVTVVLTSRPGGSGSPCADHGGAACDASPRFSTLLHGSQPSGSASKVCTSTPVSPNGAAQQQSCTLCRA
jgi:hypothetical protein